MQVMKYRKLGNDLEVSAVGLGCMGMTHAYGDPADKDEMIELMAQAVDTGYTFFDTAEVYGPFENEKLIGQGLKPYRNRLAIATKFGVTLENGSTGAPIPNSRPEVIRKSVEGSLKRLQTDYIDLYYQHRVDPDVPPEEVAGVMKDLINEGKIRYWGISEVTEEVIRRAHTVCPITAVENRYSMMARHYESLFPVLEELNIGFVAFSPMANGLLTGQYDKNSKFGGANDYRNIMPQFKAEAYNQNRELLRLLHETAAKKAATPAQISLAWMMSKKPWIVPIPGTTKTHRMIENARATDIELTMEEVARLDRALDHMDMSEVFGGTKQS